VPFVAPPGSANSPTTVLVARLKRVVLAPVAPTALPGRKENTPPWAAMVPACSTPLPVTR